MDKLKLEEGKEATVRHHKPQPLDRAAGINKGRGEEMEGKTEMTKTKKGKSEVKVIA